MTDTVSDRRIQDNRNPGKSRRRDGILEEEIANCRRRLIKVADNTSHSERWKLVAITILIVYLSHIPLRRETFGEFGNAKEIEKERKLVEDISNKLENGQITNLQHFRREFTSGVPLNADGQKPRLRRSYMLQQLALLEETLTNASHGMMYVTPVTKLRQDLRYAATPTRIANIVHMDNLFRVFAEIIGS